MLQLHVQTHASVMRLDVQLNPQLLGFRSFLVSYQTPLAVMTDIFLARKLMYCASFTENLRKIGLRARQLASFYSQNLDHLNLDSRLVTNASNSL